MLSFMSYHVKHVNELLVHIPKKFKVTTLLFSENELLFHIEMYFGNEHLIKKLFVKGQNFIISTKIIGEKTYETRDVLKTTHDNKEFIVNDLIKSFTVNNLIDFYLEGKNKSVICELTQYEVGQEIVQRNINTSLFLTNMIHYTDKGKHYLVYQFGDYYSVIKGFYNKNGEIVIIKDESMFIPINKKFNLLTNKDKDLQFKDLVLKIISEFDVEEIKETILVDETYVPIFSV